MHKVFDFKLRTLHYTKLNKGKKILICSWKLALWLKEDLVISKQLKTFYSTTHKC